MMLPLNCEFRHETFSIRTGIHTGKSLAGVVGQKMPRFYLFGKVPMFAETLESRLNRVQISQQTYNRIYLKLMHSEH